MIWLDDLFMWSSDCLDGHVTVWGVFKNPMIEYWKADTKIHLNRCATNAQQKRTICATVAHELRSHILPHLLLSHCQVKILYSTFWVYICSFVRKKWMRTFAGFSYSPLAAAVVAAGRGWFTFVKCFYLTGNPVCGLSIPQQFTHNS